MPDIKYGRGSFRIPASTGSANHPHGLSFTPKALIIVSNLGIDASPNHNKGHFVQNMGFWTATEQMCNSCFDDDQVGTSDPARGLSNSKVIVVSDHTLTVISQMDITSVDGTNIVANWTNVTGGQGWVQWFAFGGDDLQAKIISWAAPTSAIAKTITGVGFTPTCAINMNCTRDTTPVSETRANGALSFGATDGVGEFASTCFQTHGKFSGVTNQYMHDGVIANQTLNSVTFQLANFTSFNSDGMVVTFSKSSTNHNHQTLFLAGVTVEVGTWTQKTSTGTHPINLTAAWKPGAAIFSSCGQTTIGGAVGSESNFSIGWALSASDRANIFADSLNGNTNMHCATQMSEAHVVRAGGANTANPSAIVTDAVADLDSFADGQIVLDYETADATARLGGYIAFKDETIAAGGQTGDASKKLSVSMGLSL